MSASCLSLASSLCSPGRSDLRQAAAVMVKGDPATELAPLVRQAQQGSRQAMTDLHRRFAPMVHAIALAHVRHSDAADLTQQAFVTALRRLPSLRDPNAFGPWLGQIARNAARDHLRRKRPTTSLDHHEPAAAALGPQRVDAQRVVAAIRQLPEQQAEILLMRLLEGMSGPEIAGKMKLKPGTVRVALHRGMAKLRKQLQADGGGS